MSISDRLDQIAQREQRRARQDSIFTPAHTDVPDLLAALRAVLDLHRSDGHEPWSCGEPECVASCTACEWDYPCPTVRAITAALGEES